MKKTIISILAVLVIAVSLVSPALAYNSGFSDGTGLTQVQEEAITAYKEMWRQAYSDYSVAKESGDTVAMNEALDIMNDAHVHANSIRDWLLPLPQLNQIANYQMQWRQAYDAYTAAKASGNTTAMNEALKIMNEAHAQAESIREAAGLNF